MCPVHEDEERCSCAEIARTQLLADRLERLVAEEIFGSAASDFVTWDKDFASV